MSVVLFFYFWKERINGINFLHLDKCYLRGNIVIQCITINKLNNIMREIINISLPPIMAKTVRSAVKTGDYISTSEFFRDLLRDWQTNNLLNELNESRKEIKVGKGKILKSLKDLK